MELHFCVSEDVSRKVSLRREDLPSMQAVSRIGWVSELCAKERTSRAQEFIPPCFPSVDAMGPDASCACHHGFPHPSEFYAPTMSPNKPFPPSMAFVMLMAKISKHIFKTHIKFICPTSKDTGVKFVGKMLIQLS